MNQMPLFIQKMLFGILIPKDEPLKPCLLNDVPISEWLKIYCELNSWKIPPPFEKPTWWDEEFSPRYIKLVKRFKCYLFWRERKHRYIYPVFNYIDRHFTEYEKLKYHNTVNRTDSGKMTEQEFEEWWKKRDLMYYC